VRTRWQRVPIVRRQVECLTRRERQAIAFSRLYGSRVSAKDQIRDVIDGIRKTGIAIVDPGRSGGQSEVFGDQRLEVSIQSVDVSGGTVVVGKLTPHKVSDLDVFVLVVVRSGIQSQAAIPQIRLEADLEGIKFFRVICGLSRHARVETAALEATVPV
jgi:hypothetical protein